jgi:hypothetical protein
MPPDRTGDEPGTGGIGFVSRSGSGQTTAIAIAIAIAIATPAQHQTRAPRLASATTSARMAATSNQKLERQNRYTSVICSARAGCWLRICRKLVALNFSFAPL